MNEVYISKYRLVEDAKPHYVYTVEVVNDGVHHSIEKRYSAFHALHREVRNVLCFVYEMYTTKCRYCSTK